MKVIGADREQNRVQCLLTIGNVLGVDAKKNRMCTDKKAIKVKLQCAAFVACT